MTTLSAKLGMPLSAPYVWERIKRVGVAAAIAEDRRATLGRLTDWLEERDLDGRDVPAMIRRELLEEKE